MSWLDFREPVNAWSHFLWMWLAIPGTVLLWRRSSGDGAKQLSMLVFGLSLVFCYFSSTLFHGAHAPKRVRALCTLDHISIYLLIAGSYTPAVVVLLRGWWRWSMLGMSWLLAAAGISMRLTVNQIPPSISSGFYLAMGWGAILCYFEMAHVLSQRALRTVVLGGVLYSIGALVHLLHWPTFAPGVFGPHELMHLFVMGGSLAHFWFMLTQVIPFQRPRFGLRISHCGLAGIGANPQSAIRNPRSAICAPDA